ncbi:MAG TPA: D-alanyl-D-alanine carboxypeptidase [Ruminococcaceae bacterium]|nr:D-alanyl-D-alanine carboxypeptidase [Oscillospiraceae bacterium]HCB91456.1 D-alanyl-D-alanine carboxypeptidase [Oscillospiraceae bacterium]
MVALHWKIGICALALAVVLRPAPARAETERAGSEPSVSAKAAAVVNADDGAVLYAKNERQHLAIASTTKIMTALLTLEAARDENRAVTISAEMIRVEGSSMGLRAGDRLTLRDLAAGMLSVSGNDAANAAALAVAGTQQAFADKMNAKAAALGLKDTHFVTPSGLDDGAHYSCAYDMAQLACAAMKNADFAEIAGKKALRVRFLSPAVTRTFPNHNKLLSQYAGCNGVKTGFTDKAGRCLVSSAERNGVRVIAVTLNDPDDWRDHKALLDYGFSKLTGRAFDDSSFRLSLPVAGGAAQSVAVRGSDGGSRVLRTEEAQGLVRTVELPQFVYAPVEEGQALGCVRYTAGGVTVAQTELTAAGNVPRFVQKNWLQKLWEGIRRLFSRR